MQFSFDNPGSPALLYREIGEKWTLEREVVEVVWRSGGSRCYGLEIMYEKEQIKEKNPSVGKSVEHF